MIFKQAGTLSRTIFKNRLKVVKVLRDSMAIVLACFLIASVKAQSTIPTSSTQQVEVPAKKPEDVVRITTNLVQLDVTVLDQKGQSVTDLTADDFMVSEDGRPQKITNLMFIAPASVLARPPAATAVAKPARGAAPIPPPPPVTLRREQVRRTIALVVDDLGLSFESSHNVREALKKFVDEQMQPGDLVAIIRTGAGMGALQQFTADKRLLYAAIERVRYNLNSRGFNAFAPIQSSQQIVLSTQTNSQPSANSIAAPTPNGGPGTQIIDSLLNRSTPGIQANQYRDDIFSVGTLGAINFIVRGLSELQGRKSIVLFSDGFRLYDEDQGSQRVLDSLNRLVDMANRASVVIYTIDPRGLQTLSLTAADDLSGSIAPYNPLDKRGSGDASQAQWSQSISTDLQLRSNNFFATQQGLGYLAGQTGGLFIGNNNDIGGALRRMLNDQKGYYLLGYRPDDSILEQRRGEFHHFEIKVKRPGLTIRTRKGFYGFTENELARPVYRTALDHLYAALASPFASGDIHVRMSSVFGYDPERSGPFTESILHIDSRDLTFVKLPDGTYKASFQILTATFGDNGRVVDQAVRGYSVAVQEAKLERMHETGLIYVVTLPIKKPGAYQLRMAIRDSTSAHVGTVNQFLEVPDVKKKRLTLSGIILGMSSLPQQAAKAPASNVVNATQAPTSPAPALSGSASIDRQIPDHPLKVQAIRRFQQRQILSYGYYVYGARLDSSTHRPRLEIHLRLFRDGKVVYEGKPTLFEAAGQSDMRQLAAGGQLTLGTDLPRGEYVLQIIVVDTLAKGEASLATQWMDFDLF